MLITLSRTRMVQMPRTILAATTKPLTPLSVRCFVTNDDGRGFATRVMRDEADKGQPLMRKVPNHLQRLEEGKSQCTFHAELNGEACFCRIYLSFHSSSHLYLHS